MKKLMLLLVLTAYFGNTFAQISFAYDIKINPDSIPNLPALQSFAFARSNQYVLMIGGRKDGLHARQPFNAFPGSNNNTDIFVVDIQAKQVWQRNLSFLSNPHIVEQLQSTNMNFYQDDDTLVLAGGYAYANSVADHITFPYITTLQVSNIIDAVIHQTDMNPYIKQMMDTNFAITGGQLGKIGQTYFLVGGQKFTGRYNPMGNPTYTQVYKSQILQFSLFNYGPQPQINIIQTIQDAVHLRRRDYNLLPQIFPPNEPGYLISSGVFQPTTDLPFLYPVEIKSSGYTPITSFNQYLSNYHSAKIALYDSLHQNMHNIFLGGLSQYYYQNGTLIQDNNVPFSQTISRVSRDQNGNYTEQVFSDQMPGYIGTSAEFICASSLPFYVHDVIALDKLTQDSIVLGYIMGGINSTQLNPFTINQTQSTTTNAILYQVSLVKQKVNTIHPLVDGKNPYQLTIYPNPCVNQTIHFTIDHYKGRKVIAYLSSMQGQIVWTDEVKIHDESTGQIHLDQQLAQGNYELTIVIDGKFYCSQQLQIEP